MSTSHRWLLLPLFVALIGSGCVRSWSQTAKPAGPTVATFESLSPAEAAKKINLVAGNVIIMKQSFSGVGVAFAEQMGLGPDVERKIVIKKFAPGFRADIEWQASSTVNGVSKTQKGSVTGGDLQKSHSLELPAFWTEGDRGAFDTGILWLSQDVYENLDRTQSSTFHFGMTDPSFVGTINAGKSFDAALASLAKDVEALTSTDAFLSTTEPERRMWMLRINQKDVKVQVIKGTNWFGDFIVLDNPQNPLVLSVTPREGLSGDLFDGFFGYEITEIQGIQE